MQYKTLLAANAVLAGISGLACVVAPATMLSIYDVSLPPMGLVVYQFWGASLIGVGMLSWIMRGVTEGALQRKTVAALLVTNAMGVVMAVRGQLAGANASGWSTVALFALLAAGCVSVLLFAPKARRATADERSVRS